MFKVKCIATKWTHPDFIPIPFGEDVTVSMERINRLDGLLHYRIAEYPFCIDGRTHANYCATNFIRLGGPDMTERDEAYQREQLAVEGKLFQGIAEILATEEPMPQDVFDRSWEVIQNHLNRTI